jgi:hypothetical protein
MGLAFDTARSADRLLERDGALWTLSDALDDARGDRGSVLLVAGEAGSGKTADIDAATAGTLDAAIERSDTAAISKLSHWRRLAGLDVELPPDAEGGVVPEPGRLLRRDEPAHAPFNDG